MKDSRFANTRLPKAKLIDRQMIPNWNACRQDIKSAVLVLFLPSNQSFCEPASIVLTRRSMLVRTHKGQIGLPGGKREIQDFHPIDTAIREAHEEINAIPELIEVHGGLEPIKALDRSYVLPILASTTQDPKTFVKNSEVSEIIVAPWTYFTTQNVEEFSFIVFGQTRTSYLFSYHEHKIWGLTASILAHADLQ